MFALSNGQVERFQRDGYVLVEQLFDAEEINLLLKIAKADRQILQQALQRRDSSTGVRWSRAVSQLDTNSVSSDPQVEAADEALSPNPPSAARFHTSTPYHHPFHQRDL